MYRCVYVGLHTLWACYHIRQMSLSGFKGARDRCFPSNFKGDILLAFRLDHFSGKLLCSNTCHQSLTGRKTRVKWISLSLFYFLRCSVEDWSIHWLLVRCQKMGTSGLKVLDMLLAACMWGRCDSGRWGIAELSGWRARACHVSQVDFVCPSRGGSCLHVPLVLFRGALAELSSRLMPCSGLVMELSPLGWQHTMQQPPFLEMWTGCTVCRV